MPNKSLKISTGEINLDIERDGKIEGVLTFNPNDTLFVERYYKMIKAFEQKKDEAAAELDAIEENTAKDNIGVPDNMADNIAMEKELCDFTEQQIDDVFGGGTTKLMFGELRSMEMFMQFFEGILPYFEEARSLKIDKYTPKPKSKKAKKSR